MPTLTSHTAWAVTSESGPGEPGITILTSESDSDGDGAYLLHSALAAESGIMPTPWAVAPSLPSVRDTPMLDESAADATLHDMGWARVGEWHYGSGGGWHAAVAHIGSI